MGEDQSSTPLSTPRTMRPNGWQRLWICLALLSLLPVGLGTYEDWPRQDPREQPMLAIYSTSWPPQDGTSITVPAKPQLPPVGAAITVLPPVAASIPVGMAVPPTIGARDALGAKGERASDLVAVLIDDGQHVALVVPIAANGQPLRGTERERALEAVDYYRKTGLHLGAFDTYEHAAAHSSRLISELTEGTSITRSMPWRRVVFAGWIIGIWAGLVLFSYALGWSVAWVQEGFEPNNPERQIAHSRPVQVAFVVMGTLGAVGAGLVVVDSLHPDTTPTPLRPPYVLDFQSSPRSGQTGDPGAGAPVPSEPSLRSNSGAVTPPSRSNPSRVASSRKRESAAAVNGTSTQSEAEPDSAEPPPVVPAAGDGFLPPRPQARPSGSLGEALRNLQQYVQKQTFNNPQGGLNQPGAAIQFDTKGVEFGPWLRRFVAQVRHNWFIPQAAMSFHGHVVLTFNIHKDGSITDVAVLQPADIDGFNKAAIGAITGSNPTEPLPPEYPSDKAFFTVTFYYNEDPDR